MHIIYLLRLRLFCTCVLFLIFFTLLFFLMIVEGWSSKPVL